MKRFALPPRAQRLLVGSAATVVCGTGVYVLGTHLDRHYPVEHWLIWHLLPIWGYALFLNLACVAFGAFALRRLLGARPLPALERLLFSMVLGFTSFILALYLCGFAGTFKPVSAVLVPAALLVLGAGDGLALWRELLAWRASIAKPGPVERVLGTLAVGAGAAALLFLYLEALDPSAINFDATWYHFPIAQDYARLGRIVPFPGENHRAFPHLTSLVHTWALLVPRLPSLDERWMLSLHLEYGIVLWRIVGAAAVARWLLGGRDVRGLWAGFFLFPSIFVYDQAIGGSADHFLGFYAAPIVLACARALKGFDARWGALLGVALGGHLLVKYQAIYLCGAVALVCGLRLAYLCGRRVLRARRGALGPEDVPWRPLLTGALTIGLAAALVSAPHFGKNVVFYKNPVYPFAQSVFKSSWPKREPGVYQERPMKQAFEPEHQGVRRQLWALGKMFDYSLETANRNLSKHRPYMGALFSLLLPCALFLPRRRRMGLVVGVLSIAFVLWANLAPNDRYLLSFYDLCIGVALALMVQVWELGVAARIGLVPLVLLQLVWGGDAMLYYGRKELEHGLGMIADGYEGRYERRIGSRGTQKAITKALPPDAVVLARNYKGLLGLDRTVLSDVRAGQDYISYAHLEDPRDFYELIRSRGVTHLMLPKNQRKPERWNNAILFTDLFVRSAEHSRRFGRLYLAEVPKLPPPHTKPYLVLTSGVKGVSDGIWAVEQLDFDPRQPYRFSPRPEPRYSLAQAEKVLPQIRALLVYRRRIRGLSEEQEQEFEQVEDWDGVSLYLRRQPRRR